MLRRVQAIGTLEYVPDIACVEFSADLVCKFLNMAREVRLHFLWQLQPLILLQNPGKATLAGL